MLGPFHREGLGQLDHPGLRSIIRTLWLRVIDDVPRHGGRIDNGAACPLRHHLLRGSLCRQEDTGQVHVNDLLPLLQGHLQSRHIDDRPGIGEGDIKAARPFHDLGHHYFDGFRVRDIGLDGQHIRVVLQR